MGIYDVTQEQYEAVMGQNPSHFKGANNPVETVSWDDAVEFCKKLSAKSGKAVQLPTEDHWEYACRAGTTTRFSFGDEERDLGQYAWYESNSDQKTHPVGEKKPNAFGLYDMLGNVEEWCSWHDGYPGNRAAGDDPAGPATGPWRVFRGGSWRDAPRDLRSASKIAGLPRYRFNFVGFRVVVSASDAD